MLRRADEHLTAQKEFEAEAQARLDAARQKRQEEKERQEAIEVRIIPLYWTMYTLTDAFSSPFHCNRGQRWRSCAYKLRS